MGCNFDTMGHQPPAATLERENDSVSPSLKPSPLPPATAAATHRDWPQRDGGVLTSPTAAGAAGAAAGGAAVQGPGRLAPPQARRSSDLSDEHPSPPVCTHRFVSSFSCSFVLAIVLASPLLKAMGVRLCS